MVHLRGHLILQTGAIHHVGTKLRNQLSPFQTTFLASQTDIVKLVTYVVEYEICQTIIGKQRGY
jgi:hypothetical protein